MKAHGRPVTVSGRPRIHASPLGHAGVFPPWGPQLPTSRHLAVLAGLAVVVLACFANTLRDTGFILDNRILILQDPRMHSPLWEAVRAIFREDYWYPSYVSGLYRPLTTLSYVFNYAVLGNDGHATGYHAVNLILHWLDAGLVYALALHLNRRLLPAALTAALFASHPIVTESVTNIIGRADLLAALAVLAGLACYVKTTLVAGWRRGVWMLALGGFGMFGVFAKEVAVVLLPLLVLYDVTFRLRPGGPVRATPVARTAASSVPGAAGATSVPDVAGPTSISGVAGATPVSNVAGATPVPGVAGAASAPSLASARFAPLIDLWRFVRHGYWVLLPSLVGFWAVRAHVFARLPPPARPPLDNPLIGADVLTSRLTAVKVIGKELALLVWPRWLSCDYSFDQIPLVTWRFSTWEDIQTLIALVLIAVLCVLAARSYRRNKPLFFWLGFGFVTLLPTANLIVTIGSIMAERFLYLPSVGFAGGLVAAVYALEVRVKRRTVRAAPLLLGGLIAVYGVRTFVRNFDWQSDVRLWTQAVRACPNSYKAHAALADALFAQDPQGGTIDMAIAEAEKALAITDRSSSLLVHLASYYRTKGDLVAGRTRPGSPPATAGSGTSWEPTARSAEWYTKSVKALQRAVTIDRAFNEENRRKEIARGKAPGTIPDVGNDEIYWNLGLSRMRLGDYAGALEAYAYSRHLTPANPDAYFDLATGLIAAGREKEAIVPLWQTLFLKKTHVPALTALVDIYRKLDPRGCAVVAGVPGQAQSLPGLDMDCPLIHHDVCAAQADLIKGYLEARRPAWAERARQDGLHIGCSAESLGP